MNTEALHLALQQSFSPDANLRLPSEETIKNLKFLPGAPKMLLEIASEKQVRYETYAKQLLQCPSLRIFLIKYLVHVGAI